MRIRAEELEARKLEQAGYIVIRTFTRGCPDIIAFRPEDAHSIVAREVKGPGDAPRLEQRQVIGYLKGKGVNAHFYYSEGQRSDYPTPPPEQPFRPPLQVADPTPKIKMTAQQRIEQEQPWFNAGYKSITSNKTEKQFLEGIKKYSNLWYRMRAAFRNGRIEARKNQAIDHAVRGKF